MTERKTPWNPSRTATKRVREPQPVPTHCRYCNSPVIIAPHTAVYSRNYGEWPWLYLCENCRAYVGMHPFTNIPLGTLATEQLRKFRKNCKEPLNVIWQQGHMTRTEAYAWLASQMKIPKEQCHFGMFEINECQLAYALCTNYLVEIAKNAN